MESHVISEWLSEWWALTAEFEGQFAGDKCQLRDYIRKVLPLTDRVDLQPVRPIGFTLVFEVEITCQHSADWDPSNYRVELKLKTSAGSHQTHVSELRPGKRLKFELLEPCERVTLYLQRRRRLDEASTSTSSAFISRILPQIAARVLYERDYVTVRVLAEHFISDLLAQDEALQKAEVALEPANAAPIIKTVYRLRRRPSPKVLIVHQQMARYLAANRTSGHGCLLVDSEGAVLLKMHAHRYGIPRSRRAKMYLVVAIEAKLSGFSVPFVYLRENLRALCNDAVPAEVNEELLCLSQEAVLNGLCLWNRTEDEEALSTVVCFFEAARRVAPNTSIARSLLKDVDNKLREIFDPTVTNSIGKLSESLERLCSWILIMDMVCPKYGDEKFSLLLEDNLQNIVLPNARTVVTASLREFATFPILAREIVQVVMPLTRLGQLTPINDDFRLWFTDEQAQNLIRAVLHAEQEDLLLQIASLTDSHQDFANKLQQTIKRCEYFVDAFMWRYTATTDVFCEELCALLHVLRARLWSVQKDTLIVRYCVQINALREIAFSCDEIRAFLRLGPTGLNDDFDSAIREVQLKVAASQSALVCKLSAKVLKPREVDSITDMVRNLGEASPFIASINAHDRPRLVVCLWKIFLFRVMRRQQISDSMAGDGVAVDSSVSRLVGELIEKLLEICPHLQPTDLEML